MTRASVTLHLAPSGRGGPVPLCSFVRNKLKSYVAHLSDKIYKTLSK